MFGFKKKHELIDDERIFAVASGELIPLQDVDDPVFSQGMMGRGYGVNPVEMQLCKHRCLLKSPWFKVMRLVWNEQMDCNF
ncbi:Glucose-specific phosphotransferase enzyme IIA component [Weissella viridescens]|uniref:Glucose-specific phosphotransferase enzyme IIA component n=1 Tax=Weissella viridescens TaxID=1629 RepID=A0A380NXZ2_WEIVI|nr:Glucose-specific phosphotransferase enzyme IIA component [Weissella viridescens]